MSPDEEKWARDFGPVLKRYALIRVGDSAVAEDLVQETFLAALRSRDRFEGRSSIQTWLTGILRHKILDHFREQFKNREVELQILENGPEDDLFDSRGNWVKPPVSWKESPEDALKTKEFREILLLCLEGIPRQKRLVLLLRNVDGLSGEEICKEFGISSTHLWVLMHRARAALRRCLEERWFKGK
ncbi:MAG: sigma-70 family RNA polymerase sigma factor [Acidobacteria bacterium]|nr:sigma-70 family RNA polymerase sigma factor [Acidobacteriota bacterium]